MPQPIDMQTEVGRLTAAERIQQVADRVSLAAQQRAAAELEEERITDETRVKESPEAQGNRVDPEEKRRRRRQREESSKRREAAPGPKATRTFYNAEEKEEVAEAPEDHRLDVSI